MRARALAVLGALSIAACGTSPLTSPADGAGDGAAPADGPPPVDGNSADVAAEGGGSEAGACPPGLASASELAATPRADVNLELLALKVSPGRVVAEEATYQRVVRDVAAIRAKEPEIAKIGFFGLRDGRSFSFSVSLETAAQMKGGTYHAWDCLNATYGAVLPFEFIRIGNADHEFVFAKLEGIYGMDVLALEYGRLPGLLNVESTAFGGDGPTICLTGGPSTWHYVLDAASGDCPAGCIDHVFRHFTTEAAGAVTALETWGTKDGTPRPAWVTQYASPAACH
jgi:hypothetical protein